MTGWAGASRTLVMKMLATRRMPRVIQKRAERNGLCGTGLTGGFWAGGLVGGGLDIDADGKRPWVTRKDAEIAALEGLA